MLLLTAVLLVTPPTDVSRQAHDERQGLPPDPAPKIRRLEPPRIEVEGGLIGPGVQVNVNDFGMNVRGDAANEPSIAVDPTAPNRIVIGWRQFNTVQSSFRQAGVAWSNDGGRSWNNVGPLTPGTFRSDPVLSADAKGRFYYYSLRGAPSWRCDLFTSEDGGATWSAPTYGFGGDKAWLIADATDGPGVGHIYAYWSTVANCCGPDTFTRSTDGGATYSGPHDIPGNPIFGTLAVGLQGELYIGGVWSNLTDYRVVRSLDIINPFRPPTFDQVTDVDLGGGMNFANGPNPNGLLGQAWIAVDHSSGPTRGNIYLAGTVTPGPHDPADVHFVRSEDDGLTFSPHVRVNDDSPGLGDVWYQWFGTMSVAPNGRIDMIWNDTRFDDTTTFSQLYYSFSEDGGVTWSVNQPLSFPFNHFLGYPQQNKLGDYYHMVSDDVGAHLAWASTFNGEQDVYYLRIGDYDCNGNGVGDEADIADGTSADCDGNGIPDECEIAAGAVMDANGNGVPDDCDCALADVTGDGAVDVDDLVLLLSAWGACDGGCAADIDGDEVVGVNDLIIVLASWGC